MNSIYYRSLLAKQKPPWPKIWKALARGAPQRYVVDASTYVRLINHAQLLWSSGSRWAAAASCFVLATAR